MDTVVEPPDEGSADAYKIVTTARKPSDNLRVLAAAKALPKQRMIVLAMGELGFPTRVLSPCSAALTPTRRPVRFGDRRRPGERGIPAPSVSGRETGKAGQIYGVIADPIRHSISPAVHNRRLSMRGAWTRFICRFWFRRPICAISFPWPPSCRWPVSASPFRTSRNHSLPGRGGPAGAAHRRGQHRVAQGRQVARHEYRRGGRHRSAGAAAARCAKSSC